MTLRQMCTESPRFSDVSYLAFKKEIGALEIHEMEYYFLDILKQKIKVSNACNSTVAYLIGITDELPKNSLRYKGGTIPDIDLDNQRDYRDEGKEYLKATYGADMVASIGTYQLMYAKGAIRNVGRSLGKPLDLVNRMTNLVPDTVQGINWHVDKALETVEELAQMEKTDPEAREILKFARKLDGVLFARSKHAAGIVISPRKIAEIAPVRTDDEGNAVLEFDGNETESLGMLKIDLLGLKTLDIIQKTIEFINRRHNRNITVKDIPFDDPATYKLIASGNLMGIFQLEGPGISGVCRSFKPKNVLDVSMISAVYRPGPIKFIPSLLAVKAGRDPELEPHSKRFPVLKDILSETYGYFVYQEQIQKVAEVLAGFNDSEADNFRRVIAKKKVKEMAEQMVKFAAGAKKNGVFEEESEILVSEIESFSSYCFNKSHSVAYSLLSVITAWLKAHYPAEFYAANIIYELSSIDKVIEFIVEAQKYGIIIQPPDVNTSRDIFTVVDDTTIRYGLSGITEVGASASEPIIKERERNGPYKSITDFLYRLNPKTNVVRNMIKAGCFDLMASRAQLFYAIRHEGETPVCYIDDLMDMVKHFKEKEWAPLSFDSEWIQLPSVGEYSTNILMAMEKEVTHLWLTSHPILIYQSEIAEYKSRYSDASVGIMAEHKLFKNKNGLWFRLEGVDRKFFIFQKQFNELQKKGGIKIYADKLIIVHTRPFDAEQGAYAANGIYFFEDKIKGVSEKVRWNIPLNNDGLRILQQNKHVCSMISKTNPLDYMLFLKFQGMRFSATACPGYLSKIPT